MPQATQNSQQHAKTPVLPLLSIFMSRKLDSKAERALDSKHAAMGCGHPKQCLNHFNGWPSLFKEVNQKRPSSAWSGVQVLLVCSPLLMALPIVELKSIFTPLMSYRNFPNSHRMKFLTPTLIFGQVYMLCSYLIVMTL